MGLFSIGPRPSRSGRRRRVGALLAILLALVLAGFGWAFLLPDFQIRLDPAMVLFGIAACILAWSFYVFVDRRAGAGGEVLAITYDFRLAQPTLPGGRYRFELEVFHELESRGKRTRRREARIDLTFRRGDHPDLWEWCSREIARYLRAHRRLAERRHPEATVVLAPPPSRRRRAALAAPGRGEVAADALLPEKSP